MFRLVVYPKLHDKGMREEFNSFKEATAALHVAANLLLFLQDDLLVMGDYPNLLYLEELVDGEWLRIEGGVHY